MSSDAKATKARRACLDKMNEFRKIGVRIEPFFINPNDPTGASQASTSDLTRGFEINKFYADVFAHYDDDRDDDGEESSFRGKRAERVQQDGDGTVEGARSQTQSLGQRGAVSRAGR